MLDLLPSPGSLTIAHTIQLVVAPVFLLSGIGALLNVFTLRLNRVVDRARHIEGRFNELAGQEHDRAVWELRILDRRMTLISASITLCTVSAVTVSLVVAGLFIARLLGGGFGRTVAGLFITSMAALIVALLLFLFEIRLANRTLRIRHELLERGKTIGF